MEPTGPTNDPVEKSLDPWLSRESTEKEISEKKEPVNYKKIVGDNRVVLFGEAHGNQPIREHIIRHAKDLKDAGITHYAIEANQASNSTLERLNNGEYVDLAGIDVGPGRLDYEAAIRAVATQGIKVVAIDIDQQTVHTREDRESTMYQNIIRILEEDKNAKVAVLIGSFHTSRFYMAQDEMPYIGKRLLDSGVKSTNVQMFGGINKTPKSLTDPIYSIGLSTQEFMLDFRPYAMLKGTVPFGAGECDWAVHIPKAPSIDGTEDMYEEDGYEGLEDVDGYEEEDDDEY